MVGDFDAFRSITVHLHNDFDLALFIMNQEPGSLPWQSLGILRWSYCRLSNFQRILPIDPLDPLIVLYSSTIFEELGSWNGDNGTNYSNRSAQDGNGAEALEITKEKREKKTLVQLFFVVLDESTCKL